MTFNLIMLAVVVFCTLINVWGILAELKRWVEAKADFEEMQAQAFDRDAMLNYYEE